MALFLSLIFGNSIVFLNHSLTRPFSTYSPPRSRPQFHPSIHSLSLPGEFIVMGSPGPTTPSQRAHPGAMPHAQTAPSSGPGGGSGSGGVGGGTNGVAGSSNAASIGSGSAGSGVSWRAMPSSSTRRHAQSHHDPAGSSSSVAPSATSPSFSSSPYHSNGNNSNNNIANKGHFASSSSSSPTTSSSSSGFQRTPVPKPKKYIGHYDIADRTFQLLSR